MTSVRVYEPVIDRNINDLLAWMKELKTLDVSVWTHYFAMDCSMLSCFNLFFFYL